jgi:hypothetical protein
MFSKNHLWTLTLTLGLTSGLSPGESNWGRWGKEDQIGTLNYISPEVVQHAVSLVKQGKVFNLALPLEKGVPSGGPRYGRIQRYMVAIGSGDGNYETAGLAIDHLLTPVHGPTHWDGLAHIFGESKLYNGYDARTNITAQGALKDGVEHAADNVVTRGVLVDVARYKKTKWLASGYVITPADLEGGSGRGRSLSYRRCGSDQNGLHGPMT